MANIYKSQVSNLSEKKNCQKNNKKKLTFKIYKKNTLNSLNEVEHFLKDFNRFIKYIKLYKILK